MFLLSLFLIACSVNDKTNSTDSTSVVSESTSTEQDVSDQQTAEDNQCDPLDPYLCAFPFPSSFFMREDASTSSGWRVDFRERTLPVSANDVQTKPELWNERDGFSPLTPIMTFIPHLSLQGVMGHDRLQDYQSETVNSLIIDAVTGERIPHFVELDMSHDREDERPLILRPVVPMQWGKRYVVALRGLVDVEGNPIVASEAFQGFRDGSSQGARAEHFETTIFPAIEAQGWERSKVQLAWDFVVASKQGVTGKMVWMRDDAIARVGEAGPAYTIERVETFTEAENIDVAKRIHGQMTVPYYTETATAGTLLSRDENDMPMYMGETQRPFSITIPRSLWEEGRAGPLMQYGHGLMGSHTESHGSYLAAMANRYGYVIFAVDWTGMADEDVQDIILMIVQEIDQFAMIPERCQQGVLEFVMGMKMMIGAMANDPEVISVDSNGQPVSVIDTSRRYYYGNSQGGILGSVYTAVSPDVERAVWGVGGAPYSTLLTRSIDFDGYFMLLKTMYEHDYKEISLLLGLMQTLWDSAEPSGYLDAISIEPLVNTPAKQVLIQVAIADAQVPTLGAHIQARGIGAKLLQPAARDIWGLEPMESGDQGSALVEWEYGLEEPFTSIPPPGEDPHEWVRREFLAQEQLHQFFTTGEVVNYCDGPCVDIRTE